MGINSTLNASDWKVPFEVLYDKYIPFSIDFLLSQESSINPQAHKFARKIWKLIDQVKMALQND